MDTNKKTAVAYCRYSSDNQRDASIDAQLRAIKQYAEHNGFIIIEEYVDRAKTATTDRREDFQRMIKDSKKRQFEYVLVHKLDRFARNRQDSIGYRAELKLSGVSLISVLEPIGNDPESIILEAVLEAFAEYYSVNLAREVKKGQRENALKCQYTGGFVPYGFKINPETKQYEIVEHEAVLVREAFNMYANNKTYGEILTMLDCNNAKSRSGKPFSKNIIGDMLSNEKYNGAYTFNVRPSKDAQGRRNSHGFNDIDVIRIPNGVPRIVPEDIFNRVQERKQSNKYGTRSKGCKETYLLTGLVKCGCCGHAMTGNTRFSGRNKIKYVTYRCTNRDKVHKCKCKEVNRDYLESFVLDVLIHHIFSPQKADQLFHLFQSYQLSADKSHMEQQVRLKAELNGKQVEIENLMRQLDKGLASDLILQRLDSKSCEVKIIETELHGLEKSAPKPISRRAFNKLLEQARKAIKDKENPDALRGLIQFYIQEIKANEDNISVVLTFHNVVVLVGGGEGN